MGLAARPRRHARRGPPEHLDHQLGPGHADPGDAGGRPLVAGPSPAAGRGLDQRCADGRGFGRARQRSTRSRASQRQRSRADPRGHRHDRARALGASRPSRRSCRRVARPNDGPRAPLTEEDDDGVCLPPVKPKTAHRGAGRPEEAAEAFCCLSAAGARRRGTWRTRTVSWTC